ncbi:uncharacterized protein LOC109864017 [Pseudomyrmex gracilis]|uniref:uncharacterized protein LOC109864017 n=1 Tax=Pseudomyrmex gracilis TaxID=219809 RepID=UPI000994BEAD|nr:uncharacterized protein LOC109864017 [Pseudomyrmex gracilis]
MSNKTKRKISETKEELSVSLVRKKQASETEEKSEVPEKKGRASGKCSTCKIHGVDALAGAGHKHVCPHRTCFCIKCIENARKKDKSATDIRISRTKKIFDKKQELTKEIEITLSEEKNPWPDIKMNLEKEKEGDYYDLQEFLKILYSVIVDTNVIEQSSFAMRMLKACFEVLTASIEGRISKKVANKACQNIIDVIQKLLSEEFQQQQHRLQHQQQLQPQQHPLQQQQQQLQQHPLPPPSLQHQQLQYSSQWYSFLLDPRFLRSVPATYNYTYLKKETPPEEFNVLLNQVRSSVPYKSLEFSSKYH